jgi:hypothetical protein
MTQVNLDKGAATPAATTISVNVGPLGNVRRIQLSAEHPTVGEALRAAGLSAEGYQVRISGDTVGNDARVNDGQTVLLLRAVRGNVDLDKGKEEVTIRTDGRVQVGREAIKVNVGPLGNVRQVVLSPEHATVGDAVRAAGLSAEGYQIRISGDAVNTGTRVVDGQTILLLRAVRGNA